MKLALIQKKTEKMQQLKNRKQGDQLILPLISVPLSFDDNGFEETGSS